MASHWSGRWSILRVVITATASKCASARHWVAAFLVAAVGPLAAQQNAGSFFESSVQPVLKTNCLPCHNQRNPSSGLALDSRESMLTGGNRGAAVKPGAPAESLLIQAVEQ